MYAPFSGIGGIVYDKDAVYVELGGSHSHKKRDDEDEEDNIVSNLIETKETLDVKMEHSELQLFTGGKKLTAKDFEENNTNTLCSEDEIDININKELNAEVNYKEKQIDCDGRIRRKVIFNDDDSMSENTSEDVEYDSADEMEDNNMPVLAKDSNVHLKIKNVLSELTNKEKNKGNIIKQSESHEYNDRENSSLESEESNNEDEDIKWKNNLAKKAQNAFLDRISSTQNLMKMVYSKWK